MRKKYSTSFGKFQGIDQLREVGFVWGHNIKQGVEDIVLYKALIRSEVLYGVEAWTMTKKDEQALPVFEGKIFRRIYGPKYENGGWKSRTNQELEQMSKGENILKWIKGQRISWLVHLERMEEDKMTKKSSHKNWKGRDEGEDPVKDGKRK
jgi:hypothetical protein